MRRAIATCSWSTATPAASTSSMTWSARVPAGTAARARSGACARTRCAPMAGPPPMGLRVRLKASVDISRFGPQARVILQALKTYGIILADNGSPWYIAGAPDPRWNDDDLHQLKRITGADLEVVDTSHLRNGP